MALYTSKSKIVIIIILVAILIVGLILLNKNKSKPYQYPANTTTTPTTKKTVSKAPVAGPDFKNATYIIDDSPITLVNGKADSNEGLGASADITTEYFGNEAQGDLNGDGLDDTAFLIAQYGGGTGVFYYLAVALKNPNDGYTGTNAIIIGDRIKTQSIDIMNGQITVNYTDRKPSDPMTAEPTVKVIKHFKVVNNKLVSVE